ncbi:MAG: tetratricopeptide repeat protein [Gammaproteobacteria bacterium]|nr:tetratricopeptide repeat protein [Gammaproteobacteria bacterium]
MMKREMTLSANTRPAGGLPALALALCLVAGCSTTTSKPEPVRPSAQLEVVEEIGFTIAEEQVVSADVDLAYQDALRSLGQGMLDDGIARLEQVTALAPGLAAPRISLGMAHHIAGDLDSAEAQLLQAIEVNPLHPVAHNELGIIYRKTGRFAAARSSYEAALDVYPGYHHARRNLAILCDLYLSDLKCAMQNYEAYMATVPNDEEVEIWMADLRLRTGNQ